MRRWARFRHPPPPNGCRTSSTARRRTAPRSCRRRAQGQLLLADDPRRHPRGREGRYEEFFGPVASVYKVGSEDEAVRIANDTPFGLGSYVFTTDAEQAERVANKIDAGMVYVNLVGADGAELPFGGVKRSGSGRELGRYGAESS